MALRNSHLGPLASASVCIYTKQHQKIGCPNRTNIGVIFHRVLPGVSHPCPGTSEKAEFSVYFLGSYLSGHNIRGKRSLCSTICEVQEKDAPILLFCHSW